MPPTIEGPQEGTARKGADGKPGSGPGLLPRVWLSPLRARPWAKARASPGAGTSAGTDPGVPWEGGRGASVGSHHYLCPPRLAACSGGRMDAEHPITPGQRQPSSRGPLPAFCLGWSGQRNGRPESQGWLCPGPAVPWVPPQAPGDCLRPCPVVLSCSVSLAFRFSVSFPARAAPSSAAS